MKLLMQQLGPVSQTLFALFLSLSSNAAPALIPRDWAVETVATVSSNPSFVNLTWRGDPYAKSFTVFRKFRDDRSWNLLQTLPGSATGFLDTSTTPGIGYEYKIEKLSTGGQETWTYNGYGYIYAGSELPLVEDRGKVILLVESSVESGIQAELSRLELDLISDGWGVIRSTAAAGDAPTAVRAKLQSLYAQDPTNIRALFLIGHIPVAYSGDITPDEHPPIHQGAWPADTYYADLNGTWTDNSVTSVGSEWPDNHNVPGDGKFDQSLIPSGIELQVGRVDMWNLTCFANKVPSVGEIDLLRRYLDKDHAFRSGQMPVEARGILFDSFFMNHPEPEPIGANAWRTFAVMTGSAVDEPFYGKYFSTVASQWYLWSSADVGGGGFTIAYYDDYPNFPSTSDVFATQNVNVVFSSIIGSYFGDWNNESNFLRASLGANGGVLTAAYAGKPQWLFHHMALGETIGFAEKVTQENDNNGPYLPHVPGTGQVHISLLGDPTLRAHPLSPVSNLSGVRDGNTLQLSWGAANIAGLRGYAVYRAAHRGGPYQRITPDPIQSTTYSTTLSSPSYFMVKPIALTQTPAGTYYNSGMGAFYPDPNTPEELPPEALPQTVRTTEDTPVPIQLAATGPANLNYVIATQPQKGKLSGTPPNLIYTPAPDDNGMDSFTFVVNDGVVQTTPAVVTVQVEAQNDPPTAGNISISALAGMATPINLAGRDVDADPLQFLILSPPTQGQLSGTGSALLYTAFGSSKGTDSFTYTVSDPSGSSATGIVSIQLTATNHPPTANDLSLEMLEGQSLQISLLAGDPDGDPLTFTITKGPGKGRISGTSSNLLYLPEPGFNGSDSFRYVANDGASSSSEATVSIKVIPVNDPPTAQDLWLTTPEDIKLHLTLAGSDRDGDALTFQLISAPSHGTLDGAAPSLDYIPLSYFTGSDSFIYTVSDGVLTSSPATVHVTVTPVNHAPVAQSLEVVTEPNHAITLQLEGADIDGDRLSYQLLSAPSKGSLSGTLPDLIYTPYPGATGRDSFDYRVNDGIIQSATGTVMINISPDQSSLPTARDDDITVQTGDATFPVRLLLANDSAPAGAILKVIDVSPITTKGGTAVLESDVVRLTPPAESNFDGDLFTYTVSDGAGHSATATIRLHLIAAGSIQITQFGSTGVVLQIQGPQRPLQVLASSNGKEWNMLGTGQPNANGSAEFRDTRSPSHCQFYKVIWP